MSRAPRLERVQRPRRMRAPREPRAARGIPLRTVAPNAVTAMALCSGLTAIRFAISGQWELAVLMVMIAALLDGIDGTVARLVRGESRFGAELDSLSDAIAFGVAPALILYLWSLQQLKSLGWLVALLHAVFCALRLARFNAAIDSEDQPHKSAGFLTGVPAPAAAILALTPLYPYLWLTSDAASPHWPQVEAILRSPLLVAPWSVGIALLMVSSLATFRPALRLRQRVRFEAVVLLVVLVAALVAAPWPTLAVIAVLYLLSIPFSVRNYRRIRQQRAAPPVPADAPAQTSAP